MAAEPKVVLISQLGTGGRSWQPVGDLLTDVAVFTYDRPGTGEAPGRPGPNPALPYSAWARELAEILDHEGVTEPAVIVGHSFGGNIARVYAGLYPERVAGLVFVDSSIPQMFLEPNSGPKLDGEGPEATEIDTVRGQVEIMTLTLPRVPALVLSREPGAWDGQWDPPHEAVEDLWIASQRALAHDVGAPLVVADRCGHQIPRDRPALVAYAVRQVLDAIQEGRQLWPSAARLAEHDSHIDEGRGTDLPVGSIVAMRDLVAYRDDQNEAFPWSETSTGAMADSYIREMLDGGYAVLVRRGFDGAPPAPLMSTED
jgi:pimeloyl-ACP methyl ester carboxylesterase